MRRAENNSTTAQQKQMLQAISGDVELPRVSQTYVAGLAITAFAVLLLPLLYLALVTLLIAGITTLIRYESTILAGWTPAAKFWLIALCLLFSVICLLGMIKPFLARSSAVKRPRTLRQSAEPFLYEYVDRLCDALGANRPTDIHVSCDLNAGAEFRRGWLSIFSNRQISLHLGLPLVAGLTLKQFTGVLAHELGHFTQRTAMWLENIVRRTNDWFMRAASENDAIDDWLAHQRTKQDGFAVICAAIAGLVWLTRWVPFGLAIAGNTISCLMSRQMEFNADRCQVRTVGPKSLASTMWRMRELSVAHQMSFRDVEAFYVEGRLPDNMIALAVANIAFVTPKVKRALRRMMREDKTGLFDSHPSDRERIQAAFADGSPGLFDRKSLPADLPAAALFSRFDEISKVVTTQFYEAMLNEQIKAKLLHPVDKLLERQSVEIAAAKALKRYFQTEIPPLRPLPIAPQSTEPPEDVDDAIDELQGCRERMVQELPNYKRLAARYQVAEETLIETIAAQTLIQARLRFKPADYHLSHASADAVNVKQGRAREGVNNLAGKLLPFETEAGNRLSFALQLLHIPDVVERIPQGDDLQGEIGELLPEAQYVSRLIGELPTMRIIFYRMVTLWERLDAAQNKERIVEMIVNQMSTLRKRLIAIQKEMGKRLYPFDHAQADITLKEHVIPTIPEELDLGGLVQATDQMQSRLITIQMRLFARLAQAAERIEEAIGMVPLPEPEDDDEDD